MSVEVEYPRISPLGHAPLAIRGAKTLIKRPRGVEYTPLNGITEAGSRPLLRQPSSTHQDAVPRHADLLTAMLLEALPCWAEDFV